jgi:hypothetical protein
MWCKASRAPLVMPCKRTAISRHGVAINYGGGGWKDSQTQYLLTVIDPLNANQLLGIYGGVAAPTGSNTATIGRATAPLSNPMAWTEYAGNPIVHDVVCRLTDSLISYEGTLYLYSTNLVDTGASFIELLTSTDGGFTWTNRGTVLTPTGQGRNDGYCVSQAFVMLDGSNLYMYYSYRRSGATLPGIRLAAGTVADFTSFTKQGAGDLWSTGAGTAPDATYIEGCVVNKIGATYLALYSGYNASVGTDGLWTINVASSSSPTGGWVKSALNPYFQSSYVADAPDATQIATPWTVLVNGVWWLYYQATMGRGSYTAMKWSLCGATLAGSPLDVI